jgi:two-component system, LytTR family, sensor kinase
MMNFYDHLFMNGLNAAMLVNLVGFTAGTALYAMLGAMVLKHRDRGRGVDGMLLLTAVLGLSWNLGELFVFIERDFGGAGGWAFVTAAAYSALGFLPSVVVHSARLRGGGRVWLSVVAFGLSSIAAAMHLRAAATGAEVPSDTALLSLTFGSLVLAGSLLVLGVKEGVQRKSVWASALLIFAVSGLHLSEKGTETSWAVELFAHQSSLPLALVILYQNYRFAFADLFLKRAISLLLITLTAFCLYIFVAAPLLRYHETHDRNDVQAVGMIITLWVATALAYPAIVRASAWFVDRVVLRRPDYDQLQASIANEIGGSSSIDELLDVVTARLAGVLTADRSGWESSAADAPTAAEDLVKADRDRATIMLPTADKPVYLITLENLRGGRKLLSDETAMLKAVALIASRRIDAVRVLHERCDREFREQEFSRLATEAQLAALRAQINPHFLFNALTTIGYLIQTAPEKAFDTLLHLTKLLRGVLSTTAEFSTVEDELRLIENYLDIEKERFEERLAVQIEVPAEVRGLKVPSLILQPLVENAIKHGVSENRSGGRLTITGSIRNEPDGKFLTLAVTDTGAGKEVSDGPRGTGVGLGNVRERLRSHYGERSSLILRKSASGTVATIRLPVAGRGAEVTV